MNNIQDILTGQPMPVNPYSKLGENDESARDDFMALMAGSLNNMDLSGGDAKPNAELGISEPKSLDINKELETKVSVSNNVKNSVKDKIKIEDSSNKVTPKEENKVVEEYSKFEEGVKKVLTEELDISEEELNAAMENLGLSFIDLAEPKNLALLLNEIKGEENGVNLLLDTSVSNIFDKMSELTGELLTNTGFEVREIGEFVKANPEIFEGKIDINPMEFKPVTSEETVDIDTDVPVVSENTYETKATDNEIPVEVSEAETKKTETNDSPREVINTAVKEDKPLEEAPKNEEPEDMEETVDALRNKMVTKEDNSQSSSSGNSNQQGTQKETVTSQVAEPNVSDHTNINQPTQTFTETIQTVEGETVVTTYTNVNTADVINQIVTQASTTITRDVTTMELLLNPQNLGRMLMQVSEQEGQITAKFITQNEAVKTALEGAMANLIERLNDQGIKVDAVEVSVGTHEFEENLEKNFSGDAREDLQGQETGEGQSQRGNRSRGGIHLGDDAYMEGAVLSEEEQLEANLMRTYGNTVNFRA